jgi:predicted metal-dependent peptidase
MTALPAPSPDAIRLREFVAQLSECSTTDERDELLGAIMGEVKEILTARPGFVRHWLLALDPSVPMMMRHRPPGSLSLRA